MAGSLASARAMAVRCCMPPESCLGMPLEAAQAHLVDVGRDDLAALRPGTPRSRGPKPIFSATVSHGNRV